MSVNGVYCTAMDEKEDRIETLMQQNLKNGLAFTRIKSVTKF